MSTDISMFPVGDLRSVEDAAIALKALAELVALSGNRSQDYAEQLHRDADQIWALVSMHPNAQDRDTAESFGTSEHRAEIRTRLGVKV